MIEVVRLCDKCVEAHLRQVEKFSQAKPDATIEEWEKFWDKNNEWQLKQINNHCHPREPLPPMETTK